MNRNLVHEKEAFNCEKNKLPFYMECLYRKISKNGPPPIYHYHDKLELLYCVKGELKITLLSEEVILDEGDFICISQNIPHATFANTDYNEHICIKFANRIIHVPSSRHIPSEDYFISLLKDYELFKATQESRKYIYELFSYSYKNYSHDDYFKRLALRANIMLIMSYAFRHSSSININNPLPKIANNFSGVFEYIDENFSTITLECAAKFCSMSYSYFSRIFKSETGISFSNYIKKKRVSRSLELLSSTNMTLNEIALECGFSNLSHYIKCFNEEMGVTPKKFRLISVEKE